MDSENDEISLPQKSTMDSENDKTAIPDNSPADNTETQDKDDDSNKNKTDENDDKESHANHQDSPPDDNETKALSSPKSLLDEPSGTKSSPAPPPDLNQVSEEIDHYISSLINCEDTNNRPLDVPICVEQFAILLEAKVKDYDSSVKWSQLSEDDSNPFIQAVNRLSSLLKTISKFSSEYKYAYSINHVGGVLQHAMSYLEEELKSLLEDHQAKLNILDAETKKEINANIICEYSDRVLLDLIRISKAMIAGGHEAECRHVYFVARRNILEDKLHKLGFEKHSIDDVHKMNWETLEREIELWIRIFRQFTATEFPGEWRLVEAVFPDYPEASFGCVAIQLLNFVQAVALTKRAAEKLFKFIDVYEALQDNLFSEEMLSKEASMIRSRLGEAMILIFAELEHSIKSDSAKSQVPGGAVHPLTKYMMNYLEYACEYKNTLEQVFREKQKMDSNTGSTFESSHSPFQAQVTKVLDLLDSNIEGKARLYKDPSLSLIFMMNNGRYMLKKIKGSEVNGVIGDGWYRRKSSDMRQYHKGYQRETWGKLLGCLHPEGLSVSGKVVKAVLKERFKSFNAMFDEIHKTQSNWVVGDEQLQSELRVSICNMVIPAYRSFLGRYTQVFTPGRQTQKYVKYQAEDIETYIDELFDGTATPMGKKKQ